MNYFHLFPLLFFLIFFFSRFLVSDNSFRSLFFFLYKDLFYAFKRLFLFHKLSSRRVWWKSFNFILMSCSLITHIFILRCKFVFIFHRFTSTLCIRYKSFFFVCFRKSFPHFFHHQSFETNLKFKRFFFSFFFIIWRRIFLHALTIFLNTS